MTRTRFFENSKLAVYGRAAFSRSEKENSRSGKRRERLKTEWKRLEISVFVQEVEVQNTVSLTEMYSLFRIMTPGHWALDYLVYKKDDVWRPAKPRVYKN